ncbi:MULTISPECIES: hypothetical protein [Streptomyces]|uniref:WXG100 family type VII secretion target n=1 Tax=Streptomyces dengpaensis TaxID=2049881 RepID=A0ABM6SME8_9ACTN|nr:MULTISPECIES: hypothetical protein [Streptomyces]AVH55828.1 hypothetical protein C4B68_08645 [Streptomyces dengpaensis]PIB12083.1 hypothetical protein B1C81_02580 [Streptomyces sp. HG99]
MANDSDLKVNVDLLVESESRLKSLRKEFKNIENRNDDMHPYWGSGEITDTMDEFVDNWDDYRAKMLESIDTVGKLVKSTIDSFEGLDADLAKGLRDGKKDKKK